MHIQSKLVKCKIYMHIWIHSNCAYFFLNGVMKVLSHEKVFRKKSRQREERMSNKKTRITCKTVKCNKRNMKKSCKFRHYTTFLCLKKRSSKNIRRVKGLLHDISGRGNPFAIFFSNFVSIAKITIEKCILIFLDKVFKYPNILQQLMKVFIRNYSKKYNKIVFLN